MRRPPIAAACECCPAFPRTAAVDEVTKTVPFPLVSISGQTADAVLNNANVAILHPNSNIL